MVVDGDGVEVIVAVDVPKDDAHRRRPRGANFGLGGLSSEATGAQVSQHGNRVARSIGAHDVDQIIPIEIAQGESRRLASDSSRRCMNGVVRERPTVVFEDRDSIEVGLRYDEVFGGVSEQIARSQGRRLIAQQRFRGEGTAEIVVQRRTLSRFALPSMLM